MKTTIARQRKEGGQAAMFVVFGLLVFGVGAMGLAIDGSHLYAERQMAQAAADSAAQAAIRSVFTGTYASGSSQAFSAGLPTFTCGASDARTPCYYAQTMNGFSAASDTVTIDEPTAAQVGVSSTVLAASAPNLLRVTVARQVKMTFFGFISSFTPTVRASATGAIVSVMSPIPIIVTHPWLPGSLSANGSGSTAKITVTGGPGQSIQVNSSDTATVGLSGNPVIDLSGAGPNGTGGSFGSWGGPSPYYHGSAGSTCASGCILDVGTTGQYISPSYPILDPLAGVPAPPSTLANAHAPVALANSAYGCPAAPPKACELYFPGTYSAANFGGIAVTDQTAVFAPGIYYMNGVDFTNGANGYLQMATGLTDSSTTVTVSGSSVTSCCGTNQGWNGTAPTSGGGMLVYMTGPSATSVGKGKGACTPPAGFADVTGSLSIGANASTATPLNGSPNSSVYKGILFFVDRNAASATESLGGGGALSLVGTLYAPETITQMGATSATTCGQYQTLAFGGNSGSSTNIVGEIIASTIALSGTPGITMHLSPNAITPVQQIAMVQ